MKPPVVPYLLHMYYVSLPDWSPKELVVERLGGSQVAWVSLVLKHYYSSFLVVLNEPFQSGVFLQFLKWVQRSVQSEFVYLGRPSILYQ